MGNFASVISTVAGGGGRGGVFEIASAYVDEAWARLTPIDLSLHLRS